MRTYDGDTGHPRHALLVDDDAALRGLLCVLLKQMGFEATVAQNGYEALEVLEREGHARFEVMITDIRMPGMDGMELARHVRATDSQLPIFFISGYSPSMGSIERGLDERSDFLRKPFAFGTFSQRVESLIERASQEQSPVASESELSHRESFDLRPVHQKVKGPV